MWKIKQIFDGDFGCEELKPGDEPKPGKSMRSLLN